MSLRLVQLINPDNQRQVAALDAAGPGRIVAGYASVYELVLATLAANETLEGFVRPRLADEVDLEAALAEGRILVPIDHPDPAHLLLSGTGLTHLGSAEGRDKMHKAAAGATETDSMRMFRLGLEGGKPAPGEIGVQPEWFYKGDGGCLVAPESNIPSPAFALDGGEEPEIAGVYLIDATQQPVRLGFCLANEFSDHVVERGNYLWLAHSKLRPAALGPELLTGALPNKVEGVSRIVRNGAPLWERPFLSGEDNMSHAIANLEQHHFKYDLFRRPGDVHVHFFGTATLSFSDGVRSEAGDRFEIEAAPFRLPLRNPLVAATPRNIGIRAL